MSSLASFEEVIREKVEVERWTHEKLSLFFTQAYPHQKGFSVRSIQRFCSDKGIHKTSRLSNDSLDATIEEAIKKVGPTYGRKTMTGLLASNGVRVSEQRVGESLHRVHPTYQQARRQGTACQLNPVPYHADYFGHKLHVDQNEKLVMFGVTHICGIDGYSGKIVGFASMPIKNCVEIYSNFFVPIVEEHGLWDQIRVDQGKEWTLMLFVQETLAHLRGNTDRAPHLQTTSKQNHCVERIWVEINNRVNYPIKTCLITLQRSGDIDLDCPLHKFCISWFTLRVANVGTCFAVQSWNEHPIPSRGVPNQIMQRNNQARKIDRSVIPDSVNTIDQFQSYGGRLTLFSDFGLDPLKDDSPKSAQREAEFKQRYVDFQQFFSTVVNGDYHLFRQGLLFFIHLTNQLSR